MDEFVSWIRNLSYDLVGLLIPGWIVVVFPLLLVDADGESLTSLLLGSDKEGKTVLVAAMLVVGYVAGILLKQISDTVVFRPYLNSNALFLWYKESSKLKNADNPLRNSAVEQLSAMVEAPEQLPWLNFQQLAKQVIIQHFPQQNLVTCQNRYELFRSLAVGALIHSFVLPVSLYIFFIDGESCSAVLLLILTAIGFIFCSYMFRRGYQRYWKLYGDLVVTYTILYFSMDGPDD